jgi:dihydrodipicolinate synthase/N-acetylneuraminate lyase
MATAAGARQRLREGRVIPAHPLALTRERRFDERRQRALTRYYMAAGAGGVAVGVHTTQFAIRQQDVGLYRPVLELASCTIGETLGRDAHAFIKVAGVCGHTAQARAEAEIAAALDYDVALVSLGDWRVEPEDELVMHCREIAEVMPVFGFYLQPAVGGRVLTHRFWRELAEVPNLWAVKIAPFNRYQTIDVVRALIEAGRDDVALYTGNDDNIVADLVTPFIGRRGGAEVERRIDGGLLGQWAVWTHSATRLLTRVQAERIAPSGDVTRQLLREGTALTDANAAIFDVAHAFAGCIPGIHEILRRQGLLAGTWCLDPHEMLSPGQSDEIDRVCRQYPWLTDDAFVAERLDDWLR